ncbi:ABC transporter substrate-binding protein [Bradyrhizobium sp. CCBAU 51765]|uniref:ABC transporter substrate-binding protein n=1 Tax=Bradyrhizobium sp. CCBAU 51765 TaxID=1325102 RepID=UPI001886C5AC|nr:ABC transporter substrate-binding protein [Bradyrhizobium sp. CCBAU 51765]QOZ10943.1 ABC transporter substrate-binding protein [Bradyrhizobium sp. CCBAU 51765]
MKRREFIMLLCGGAAAAWTIAARAQQGSRLPTIGVLLTGNPDPELFLVGFREALRRIGYIEGKNARLEVRTAGGTAALLPEKATELVQLKVDVIVTSLTPTAEAAKRATSSIPIVMAAAGDPVATGLIDSLARPGGNVTGIATASAAFAGKSIELIREVIPAARRVAVLANEADPFFRPFLAHLYQGALALGIEIETALTRPETPLDGVFLELAKKRVDALIVQASILKREVLDLALKDGLPTFSSNRQVADAGGLMSYSASSEEVFRLAAGYVDSILKGRKPADLPVSQPTRFELVINLKTAKALGVIIPPTLLARADRVIE